MPEGRAQFLHRYGAFAAAVNPRRTTSDNCVTRWMDRAEHRMDSRRTVPTDSLIALALTEGTSRTLGARHDDHSFT